MSKSPPKMKDKILYFGYGANSSGEMMEAIIGRKPVGFPAILNRHELCIQHWEEIPENVRKELSLWSSDFRSYCIRPGKETVKGNVWILTEKERELVGNWEMHGLWYQPIQVELKREGEKLKAQTEMIDDPKLKKVDGCSYTVFLNNKEKMLEVAGKVVRIL